MTDHRDVARLRFDPEGPLGDHDPTDSLGMSSEDEGKRALDASLLELATLQQRLEAEDEQALLLILQGMDGSGKDEVIRSALRGLNPQAYRVEKFEKPQGIDLQHDYLWRFHSKCPERGEIGVWNRSYYERVLGDRVDGEVDADRAHLRYRHLREFERMLVDEGTRVVKVLMNVSKDEQRERLQRRVDDPARNWEFSASDLEARSHWDEYMEVFDEVLRETSTDWAPWYVIPADHEWVRDVAVVQILLETMREMDPQLPEMDEELDGITVT